MIFNLQGLKLVFKKFWKKEKFLKTWVSVLVSVEIGFRLKPKLLGFGETETETRVSLDHYPVASPGILLFELHVDGIGIH